MDAETRGPDREQAGPAEAVREGHGASTKDGGPGSHNADETGGTQNDPASGGIPEGVDDGWEPDSEEHPDDNSDPAARRDVHGDPENTSG